MQLQLAIMTSSSFLMTLYLIKVKPFKEEFTNFSEIFNEIVVFMLTYILWSFSDYPLDPQVKKEVGWIYSAFIILIVFFNIMFFVYFNLKKIRERKKEKNMKVKK